MNQPILQKLRAFRKQLRAVLTIEGLAWTGSALAGLVVVSLVIDYLQRLTLPARLFALAVGLSALGYVVYRKLVSRLLRPMDEERLALTVEDRFPELGDRLISSLQFAHAVESGTAGRSDQSVSMMAAVSRDAQQAVGPLDLSGTIDRSRVLKSVALAAVLWAGLLGYTAVRPDVMGLWLRRNVLMMNVHWPQRTHLAVRYDEPIIEGDPLAVEIEADGRIPSTLRFRYEFEGTTREGTTDLRPVGGGGSVFRTRLQSVASPVRFQITGGDAETEWYRVDVLRRPAITEFMVCIEYPDYISRTDDPQVRRPTIEMHRAPQRISRVLPGSRIWVGTGVTKPLADDDDILRHGALVVRDGEDATRMTPVHPGEPDSDGMHSLDFWFPDGHEGAMFEEFWTGKFVADRDSNLVVRLRDHEGVANHAAASFELRVTQDREPTVRVEKDGIGDYITPQATLPLRIQARDDYAVREVRITYDSAMEGREFGEGERLVLRRDLNILRDGGIGAGYPAAPEPYYRRAVRAFENEEHARAESFLLTALDGLAVQQTIDDRHVPDYAAARELLATVREQQGKSGEPTIQPPAPWRWNLQDLELPTGSEFRFVVHATDYMDDGTDDSEPNTGSSGRVVLSVVTPNELLARLTEQQIHQRQQLSRVYDRYRAQITIEINATGKQLDEGELDSDQLQRFRSLEEQIVHLQREVLDIAQVLDQILQEMINNRVGDRRDVTRLSEDVVEPLRRLHEMSMPRLAAEVGEAGDSEDIQGRMPMMVRQDAQIAQTMASVLANLEELETYRRIIQDIQSIRQDQQELIEEIEKELEDMLPGGL